MYMYSRRLFFFFYIPSLLLSEDANQQQTRNSERMVIHYSRPIAIYSTLPLRIYLDVIHIQCAFFF